MFIFILLQFVSGGGWSCDRDSDAAQDCGKFNQTSSEVSGMVVLVKVPILDIDLGPRFHISTSLLFMFDFTEFTALCIFQNKPPHRTF